MPEGNRRISTFATGQQGAFTRAQANSAKVSNAQLRGWVQSNRLDKAGFRTYRNPMMPYDVRTELSDLMLDTGESWACGVTAAALHALDGFKLKKPFHVMVRRGRNVQRVGAYIHTTSVLPPVDRSIVDGYRVTTATRTLIDIAARTPPDKLLAAVASAFRDGKSSEDFLHARLVALRGSGRAGCRRLVSILEGDEIDKGKKSWLERRFLELLASAGLATPATEVTLTRAGDRLVRVDCLFPGTKVIVELLGYRWHRTKEQMRRDAERLNQLQLDGFDPYQFTYDMIVEEPEAALATTRRALAP